MNTRDSQSMQAARWTGLVSLVIAVLLVAGCGGVPAQRDWTGAGTATPSRNFSPQATVRESHGQKLALVIGNDDYPEAPLKNPRNDARDMAAMLARLGFEVIHEDNRTKQQMEELVRAFGDRLKPGMVGLFYFAGHGMQLSGRNYLIPVQSGIQREDEVQYHAFDVGQLLNKMESAGNNSNLVFLDACRDNPFARSFRSSASKGGFSFGDAPSGTLIAYAAKSGMRSMDGERQNGLYTETLLRHLGTPGLRVTDLLINVRNEVKQASDGNQIPWEEVGLESNFCFAGCMTQATAVQTAPVSAPAPAPTPRPQPALRPEPAPVSHTPPPRDVCPDGQLSYFGVCPGYTPPAPVAPSVSASYTQPSTKCDYCPEMVRIPSGEFWMGSDGSDPDAGSDEKPRHRVRVGGFSLGKYEVTQGQWRAVMGNNPSYFKQCGDDCPVEQVSYEDVQAYILKLNHLSDRRYRLPTEAEWEYACRAGGSQHYCGADNPGAVAWYSGENSGDTTHPAGQKLRNAWGLYDMSGNVEEWTCSAYTENGYDGSETSRTNNARSRRAVRGGSWDYRPGDVRSAIRNRYPPTYLNLNQGFRLAQD
jgi:formylglycine-generating enzyme required for sulfatase activity